MVRSYNIVDTGVTFKGHPVLLGPRIIDDKTADKLVLTQLDRFLRREFPYLELEIADSETFVKGASPPREKTNDQS